MHLWWQLAASAGLVVLMTLVHGIGVVGVTKLLKLENRSRRANHLNIGAFGLLTSIGLCLFALHLFEIGLFAIFYVLVGAIRGLKKLFSFQPRPIRRWVIQISTFLNSGG